MSSPFDALFDCLDIEPGDTIFVQSSSDWLGFGVAESVELCRALIARVGNAGTVLMPSYAFRPEEGHLPAGATFDVARTPSKVGLITEIFRRLPGTIRSEHWWLPICGQGARAQELLANQVGVVHPFSDEATLPRITRARGKLVGLGVSLNTSSFQHYPDYFLEHRYRRRAFLPEPIPGVVRDRRGVLHETSSIVTDKALRKAYCCWRITELSPLLAARTRRCDDGVFRFSYPLDVYQAEAMRLGEEALAAGSDPPWFKPGALDS